jgi:phage baseplate assembly protein gpV
VSLDDFFGGRSGEPGQGIRIIQARVVDNTDNAGLGQVTVQTPWLGQLPATVATGAAGNGRGMYFMPQTGDEVLVLLKEQPDMTAYVIGSVWTSADPPPRREPDAASHVQLIRTPGGHEITFDDQTGKLVISASGGPANTATITLSSDGKVAIKASSITLEADTIDISATKDCSIGGTSISLGDPAKAAAAAAAAAAKTADAAKAGAGIAAAAITGAAKVAAAVAAAAAAAAAKAAADKEPTP